MKFTGIVMLLLASASLTPGPVQADDRVASELALELQRTGTARVTVLFELDQPTRSTVAARAQRQREVEQMTDAVLHAAGAGFQLHHRFNLVGAVVGTLDRAALDRILRVPHVRSVGLDPGGFGHLDVARGVMGIDTIQLPPPGGLGISGQGVKVVVMDSGIDSDNVDFSGALLDESCFCSGGGGCCPNRGTTQFGAGAAEDDHGHGTWVSGHVMSQGVDGPLGAAPEASLVAVKVLDNNNSFCCASDVTAAYDWVASNHADATVLNASLGTSARFSSDCSGQTSWLTAMAQATAAVRANGTLMTASSGNDEDTNGIGAPSCLGDVMAVGATYKQDYGTFSCDVPQVNPEADDVACFSNVSPEIEILAPGAFMDTTGLGGGTVTGLAGTSFSAPLVAGCAALIKEASPSLSASDIRSILISTGVPVLDDRVGETFPRADCLGAVLGIELLFQNGFEAD